MATETNESSLEPYPGSNNTPLKLRRLFKELGIPTTCYHPTRIAWSSIPHILFRKGLYITGLPRAVVCPGGKSQSLEMRRRPLDWTQRFATSFKARSELDKRLNEGTIKVLPRPPNRNVVFEVVEDNGTTFDLGNWLDKYDRRMDNNNGLFSNDYKVPAPVPVPETTMGWVVKSESSADVTESESSSKSPASVRKAKAAANGAPQRHPGGAWNAKVRELNAKVAEVLVEAGIVLKRHPETQQYIITWADLPQLLHEKGLKFSAIPLSILPYNPKRGVHGGELDSKWTVQWNAKRLEEMEDLLESDGIAVLKRPNSSNVIVEATDSNGEIRKFTYRDFAIATGDLLDDVDDVDPTPPLRRHKRRRATSSDDDNPEVATQTTSYKSDEEMKDASNDEQNSRQPSIGEPDRGYQHSSSLTNTAESSSGSIAVSASTLTPEEEQARKAMRQRRVLEWMIAVLLFANIPCLSPVEGKRDAGCHYFLPWVLLPRYLAARSSAIVGFPAICKPIVVDNVVMIESGPTCWSESQWWALEKALEKGGIEVVRVKQGKPWLFELVEEDGTKMRSDLGYSRMWISTSFGIEVGLPTSIFAHEVSLGDPVLDTPPLSDDTESTEDEDYDGAEENTTEMELDFETENDRLNQIESNSLPKKGPQVIKKSKGYWEDLSGWGVASPKSTSKGKEKVTRITS